MLEIVPMARCHAKQVAELHLAYLKTPFHGRAGCELLALYYATVADEQGGCGYVAMSDDILLGYICGIWNQALIRKHFIRLYGLKAAAWGALQLLTRPQLLIQSSRRFRVGGISALVNEMGYELRPIVVTESAQGTGLASRLVNELLVDASQRGYASIHLLVEEENAAASALYRKTGFQLVGRELHWGQTYLRYERPNRDKE